MDKLQRFRIDECDTNEEVCDNFNKIIDKQNMIIDNMTLIEAKVLQLAAEAEAKPKEPKLKKQPKKKSKKKGSVLMKTLIALIVFALCCATALGEVTITDINYDTVYSWDSLHGVLRSKLSTVNDDVATAGAAQTGTGSIYYVDSDVASTGAGTSWTTAFDTLQEGIDACTANRGDYVYVAQGHEEDITAVSALAADCAGVTIVGFGEGEDQPEISFITAAGAELTISAADVTIYNMRFLSNYTGGITAGIAVTGDGDGARIIGCEFWETSGTKEQLIMISVATEADILTITDNRFIGGTSADPTSAITFAGGSDNTIIQNNRFYGTWSGPVIDHTTSLSTGFMCLDNEMVNLDATAGKTIQFHASATGSIAGNRCYANGTGFAIVGDAMFVAPDNIAMSTEDVETRNYATMFGPYRGDAAGTAGDSVFADFVLAQTDLDAIIADFTDYSLDAIVSADDRSASLTYPDSIADESILAFLMSKSASPVKTSYNNTTHSLEAIGDDTDSMITTQASLVAAIAAMNDTGYVGTNSATSQTAPVVALLAGFGDDYFNTGWSMIVIHNVNSDGNAPEGEIRDITDYVSDTGTFTIETTTANLENGDGIMVKRTEDLELDNPAMLGSSGTIRYVDSGTSGDGSGLTMENAYATLTLALGGATESTDAIIIASGHAETISGAYAIDDIGVLVKGLGEGVLRPTFTFDTSTANANLDVSVANVTFDNLIFTADLADLASCFDVAGGGDGLTIKNCLFNSTATSKEFLKCIDLTTGADDCRVENCVFLQVDTDADQGIDISAGAVDNLQVIDCIFMGDYDSSCVYSNQTITNAIIKGNVFRQDTAGAEAFGVGDSATGIVVDNHLYANDYATMFDFGAMFAVNNWGTDAVDQHAIRIPISAETSNVTAVADGSDLERLEYLQQLANDALGLVDVGTGNVFYVDNAIAGSTGIDWANAVATIDDAVNLCTANAGDTILVAPGHVEDLGTTDPAFDKAGITCIGLGKGEQRPVLSFDTSTDIFSIAADDIAVYNIVFLAHTPDVAKGIDITAGSENAIIEDCLFTVETESTDEFLVTINIGAASDNPLIKNNEFFMGGGNATEAILQDGTLEYAEIVGNKIYGDYSTACIYGDATGAGEMLTIRDNILYNGDITIGLNTEPCIELKADTTGFILNNTCICNETSPEESIVAADCYLAGNTYSESEGIAGSVPIGKNYAVDALAALGIANTGSIFYCDSGEPSGIENGKTWATATDTLDEAIALCTQDAGDVIFVAPGHVEVQAGAAVIATCDIEGVAIVGLSNRSASGVIAAGAVTGTDHQMPLFILDNAAATISITAANVTIDGLWIESDVADVAAGITVANTGDGAVIRNCVFRDGAADEELVIGVSVVADADNVVIENNYFSTVPAGGCANAIKLAGGMDDGVIRGNVCYGTWSTGALLASAAASVNLTVMDNIFVTTSANVGVAFNAGTTGIFSGNKIGTTESIANSLSGEGALFCFENYITGAVAASGLLDPGADGD